MIISQFKSLNLCNYFQYLQNYLNIISVFVSFHNYIDFKVFPYYSSKLIFFFPYSFEILLRIKFRKWAVLFNGLMKQ